MPTKLHFLQERHDMQERGFLFSNLFPIYLHTYLFSRASRLMNDGLADQYNMELKYGFPPDV